MKKVKISDLPRKERNAHNMIRIPAWVFGGLWTLSGLISLLVFVILNIIARADLMEFSGEFAMFQNVMSIIAWSVFLSLGLGAIYLILGFTYRKVIANGKAIMMGIAVFTLLAVVLLMISLSDFSARISKYAAADIGDEMGYLFFQRFFKVGMYVGVIFSAVYYLIPAILAYIGFHRLEQIQSHDNDA